MATPQGLRIDGLQAGYGSTIAVRDVDAFVQRGEVAGVIGPNGSGKSTLLKAIAGVITSRTGSITFDGAPLRSVAARVAFVPQREEVHWDFPVTAADVVLMGRYRSAGWVRRPGRPDRARATAALERVGLGGMGGRHISQFSGGQQQRIFFARAMVQDPVLVLLDEPFTGIDVANREIFHQVIRDFAAGGAAVLVATHDLDEVQASTDAVLCLNRRMVAFGPTGTTFTPEVLKQTFGGQVAVFSA